MSLLNSTTGIYIDQPINKFLSITNTSSWTSVSALPSNGTFQILQQMLKSLIFSLMLPGDDLTMEVSLLLPSPQNLKRPFSPTIQYPLLVLQKRITIGVNAQVVYDGLVPSNSQFLVYDDSAEEGYAVINRGTADSFITFNISIGTFQEVQGLVCSLARSDMKGRRLFNVQTTWLLLYEITNPYQISFVQCLFQKTQALMDELTQQVLQLNQRQYTLTLTQNLQIIETQSGLLVKKPQISSRQKTELVYFSGQSQGVQLSIDLQQSTSISFNKTIKGYLINDSTGVSIPLDGFIFLNQFNLLLEQNQVGPWIYRLLIDFNPNSMINRGILQVYNGLSIVFIDVNTVELVNTQSLIMLPQTDPFNMTLSIQFSSESVVNSSAGLFELYMFQNQTLVQVLESVVSSDQSCQIRQLQSYGIQYTCSFFYVLKPQGLIQSYTDLQLFIASQQSNLYPVLQSIKVSQWLDILNLDKNLLVYGTDNNFQMIIAQNLTSSQLYDLGLACQMLLLNEDQSGLTRAVLRVNLDASLSQSNQINCAFSSPNSIIMESASLIKRTQVSLYSTIFDKTISTNQIILTVLQSAPSILNYTTSQGIQNQLDFVVFTMSFWHPLMAERFLCKFEISNQQLPPFYSSLTHNFDTSVSCQAPSAQAGYYYHTIVDSLSLQNIGTIELSSPQIIIYSPQAVPTPSSTVTMEETVYVTDQFSMFCKDQDQCFEVNALLNTSASVNQCLKSLDALSTPQELSQNFYVATWNQTYYDFGQLSATLNSTLLQQLQQQSIELYLTNSQPPTPQIVGLSLQQVNVTQVNYEMENQVVPNNLHISEVYPRYIYGRLYNQTLVIKGFNLDQASNMVLSTVIYDEKLFYTSQFAVRNNSFIQVTIPYDTFRLQYHQIQLFTSDNQTSNHFTILVLDSMNFKQVYPSQGFIGQPNQFYIIMDNFYVDLPLQCKFQSLINPNRTYQSFAIQFSQTLYCLLPSQYTVRPVKEDDQMSLSVSIDSISWIQLAAQLQIISLRPFAFSPERSVSDVSSQIFISFRDYLGKPSLQKQAFLCIYESQGLTLMMEVNQTGDFNVTCMSPIIPQMSQSTLFNLSVSVNQVNRVYVGQIWITLPPIKITELALKRTIVLGSIEAVQSTVELEESNEDKDNTNDEIQIQGIEQNWQPVSLNQGQRSLQQNNSTLKAKFYSNFIDIDSIFANEPSQSLQISRPTTNSLPLPPLISSVEPRSFNLNQQAPFLIQVYGQNFSPFSLQCSLSQYLLLRPIYYNSSYIECALDVYQPMDFYIVGVSIDNGKQWIFAYDYPLNFLNFPLIGSISPQNLPSNLDSKVFFTFNDTRLDQIAFVDSIRVLIGDEIQSPVFVNLTHMLIEVNCNISLTDMEFKVFLSYDRSQFYYSGANIQIGRALILYTSSALSISQQTPDIDQAFVLIQSESISKDIQLNGTNLDYLQGITTCQVNNQNIQANVVSSSLLCLLDTSQLHLGYQNLTFYNQYMDLSQYVQALLVLPQPSQIQNFELQDTNLLLIGTYFYASNAQCQFTMANNT